MVLFFKHLNPMYIPLKATGIGTCIVPSIRMDDIDLGYIFTERPIVTHFVLENQGRRKQELRWICQKLKVEGPPNASVTLKITPDSLVLLPHQSTDPQLIVQANVPCSFETAAQCSSSLAKRRTDIFNPSIKGSFIRPLISFSKQILEFKHLHDIAAEEQATSHIQSQTAVCVPTSKLLKSIDQELTITNRAQVPLRMNFNCPEPFIFSAQEFSLDPGCSETFVCTFDPSFKKDFICEIINKKLVVSFNGHPQTMSVNLKGEIFFPNVQFSPSQQIDFGIMLMNTEQTQDVMLKNTTELPVDIFWEMASEQGMDTDAGRIFDIYPIRMHIDPFQEDIVRMSFFALGDAEGRSANYHGTAVCHIVGGPEYTVDLLGASAAIKYKIEPVHFDFGVKSYKDQLSEKFTLENLSDVPITFTVKIPRGCKFGSFTITPNEGVLPVGESIDIELSFATGLPRVYNESFFVRIGHFDEVRVDVNVSCFIPQLLFDLSRHEEDEAMGMWNEQQQRRIMRLMKKVHSTDSEDETISTRDPLPEELSVLERDMFIRRIREKPLPQVASPQRRTRKRDKDAPSIYDGPVTSRYVVNIGNIILGDKPTKEFTLRLRSSPFHSTSRQTNSTELVFQLIQHVSKTFHLARN